MRTDIKRIFGLDIYRAIAILIVVIGHGNFILQNTFLEGFPYFKMIDGVDLFFVLSGFLIGKILLKEINEKELFRLVDLLRFWKRRWFRTLPNYYLILFINYLIVRYGIINQNINNFSLDFLTFTHNFYEPFYGFFWESWSLSVEEWFYIFTPVLIWVSSKIISNKFAFLTTALIMIITPLVYRFCLYNPAIDPFWWDVAVRKTVLTRLDSIGYGVLAAWTLYYYKKLWIKIRLPAMILGTVLIFLITNDNSNVDTLYKQTTYFSLVPFTAMLFIPAAESMKKGFGRIPVAIQHISKISYSMYLINLGLVGEVIKTNFPPNGGVDSIIKYLIYWFVVVLSSTIVYKYFEKPMTRLRDLV